MKRDPRRNKRKQPDKSQVNAVNRSSSLKSPRRTSTKPKKPKHARREDAVQPLPPPSLQKPDKQSDRSGTPKPDIEDLRRFAAFLNNDSIDEIAKNSSVGTAAIWAMINTKFKDSTVFGVPMFKNANSKIPSKDAESIKPAIQDLVDRYDRLFRFFGRTANKPQVFRIGTGAFAAEYYLPQTLLRLKMTGANFNFLFQSRVVRDRDRILGTAQGVFDLSIVTYDEANIRQTLQEDRFSEDFLKVERLGAQPICLLAKRGSKIGNLLEKLPKDDEVAVLDLLRKYELIGPDQTSPARRLLDSHFQPGELQFVAEGGGWSAAKEMARLDLGIAIVPRTVIDEKGEKEKELVWRQLGPNFVVTDSMIYRAEDTNDDLQKVCQTLKEVAGDIAKSVTNQNK